MTDYGALSHEFVDKLSSLKFRLSANGCAMEGVMEGVHISCIRVPLRYALHLYAPYGENRHAV